MTFPLPSPPLIKGALVQIFEDVVGVALPNIVLFQYNPEKLSWTLTPYDPQAVDQNQRGAQAPLVQPFDPQESVSLTLELDATDGLDEGDPSTYAFGIADRVAALKKLTYPSQGLFGDLLRNANALAGTPACVVPRPQVPVILFVWGPGRVVPVRVTSFGLEETLYSPTLHPLHASVSLGLEVMTPDMFKCRMSISQKIATAAYSYTRIVEDALAIANIRNNIKSPGLPPFM